MRGDYPFTLDRSSKKYECPSCGKKRFVRYIDTSTREFVAAHVGRCDREMSCGYHYSVGQYRKDNTIDDLPISSYRSGRVFENRKMNRERQKTGLPYLSYHYLKRSMINGLDNHFIQYLSGLFGDKKAHELKCRFNIGASDHWQGATIFWQVDKEGFIRTGKVMLYDPKNGKRVKQPFNHVHWVHSLLEKKGRLKNFELCQCLFGEHQLKTDGSKVIAVVESEKTAILMSVLMPKYIWLATGGVQNLKWSVFKVLQGRKIILFPDLGCYGKWKDKAKKLSANSLTLTVSKLIERYATDSERKAGWDVADYFIRRDRQSGWAMNEDGYPLFWDD